MRKWLNKQTITAFILGAVLFITLPVFAETRNISGFFDNIRLKVNGVFVETDVEPFIVNGRTMVPARFVAEPLGATVKFNETENCVEIESIKSENTISYTNGIKYKGEINNGVPNGIGTFYWADGSNYTGEVVNGIITGTGYTTYKDGARIFGNWVNSRIVGNGYYIDAAGLTYSVNFKDGKIVDLVQLNGKLPNNTSPDNNTRPIVTTPNPAPTPTPTPEPEPDTAAYESALASLKAEYDADIKVIERAKYIELSQKITEYEIQCINLKHPTQEIYINSITQGVNGKYQKQIDVRTEKYNSDVSALKSKFGM